MIVYENQIKGMIAVCLILAIIPFINFYNLFISYKNPVFADQLDNSLVVEIAESDLHKGF